MKTKFSGFLALLLALVVQVTFAQNKTITGTVLDSSSMPLPGATVQVKGSATGTQTDFDGNYTIEAAQGAILVYSYLGFKTVEITVGSETNINVTLEDDATALDEVVVTALGIKRKQDEITSANQVVKADLITQANNPDVLQGLSGKVSGLQISTTSSGVNPTTRIVLRGNRSITGNNQALIVIDGVISNATFLNQIDPNNIESMNIIKGANGAALYGSQGSNGVIVVSTKKGNSKGGKFTVDIRSSVDFERIAYVPERQTRYGQGWATGDGFANIQYENGGWGPEFDGQLAAVGLPQADGNYIMRPYSSLGYDNIKEFFQTGIVTQNQVSLSSGDSEGYVNLSAQRQDSEFIIDNDTSKKTAFNFKGGKTLGKWSINGNATYTSRKTNTASTASLYNDLLQTATNIPVGAFENSGNEGSWNGYYYNPYWLRDNVRNEATQERMNFIGEINYQVNDHISAVLRSNAYLGYTNSLAWQNEYRDPASVVAITGNERAQNSSFQKQNSVFRNYYTDFIVNFDYDLTEDITFKANLGANNQYQTTDLMSVGGENLTIPGLFTVNNLSNGVDDGITYDDQSKKRRYAFYGQIDLGYKDFLFLNATGRNDWTSVLASDRNNYFYPSVGLSFIPTKAIEGLKNNHTLNYLKILASYVKVGNDGEISPYAINPRIGPASGFPFNSNSFTVSTNLTDPLLNPEFTTSYEVGFNSGFFDNKITLDALYYTQSTTDLITGISTSYTSGLSNSTVNIGETELKGLEIDLGLNPFQSSSPDQVDWSINIGYATNTTKVVEVSDQSDEVSLGGYTNAGVFAIKGEEYPQLKVSAYERDDQGRIIVDPSTGNPIIATDLKQMGRTTPKHIVNLNTNVSWKNFTLSATMDYRTGHVFYSNTMYNLTWPGHLVESAYNRGSLIVPNSSYLDSSTGQYVPNTNITAANTASALTQYYSTYVANVGESNVLDATAIKIRELALRYSLPKKMLENTPLTTVTLGVVARNLYTWLPKENRGYADPEANFTTGNAIGVSTSSNLPPTRTFGFSVNLIF